ncbi:MAG TPA: hypothetical protein VJB70_02390 [Candidatus Paceibacterota bacterium]
MSSRYRKHDTRSKVNLKIGEWWLCKKPLFLCFVNALFLALDSIMGNNKQGGEGVFCISKRKTY